MELLFVYGSLKKGFPRNKYLAKSNYLGTARTTSEYRLLDTGNGWPALIRRIHELPPAEEGKVHAQIHIGGPPTFGELYEVPDETMELLDQVEGVPDLFDKELIEIGGIALAFLPTAAVVFDRIINRRAMCYLYQKPIDGFEDVVTGFWALRD
jgi:gamma-glutamylcyclotransferase (GGCT)/AIG2-like uncharacterized protein YtfP